MFLFSRFFSRLRTSDSGLHYAWIILITATVVVFGALGLARFGYAAVLPEMQRGLGLDNSQAGVLATANLVGYLMLALFGGALAAKLGPRIVIAAGMTVVGISMVLTGTAHTFFTAGLFRAITGVGSGASNVPVMALLPAWFGPRRRGLAAGIGVAGSSIAMILVGPTVPRILAHFEQDGWRITWGLFGLTAIGIAILAALLLRNSPASMGLTPLGTDSGGVALPRDRATSPTSKKTGLQWGRVYRSWVVWQVGLVYMAFGFSYIIYMTFFKKYLIAEAAYTQESAGNMFMLAGWFSIACGLIWGGVSDKFGRRAALIMVYIVQAASFGLFALKGSAAAITVSAVLFGLTAWSIPAIMAALCVDLLGATLAPAGLGFVTLFFGIGQALGPAVAGTIADRTGSFVPAFILAMAVGLVGAAASSLLHRQPSGLIAQASSAHTPS